MYENLYTYCEDIKGKIVWFIFKPNFRESLTLFDKDKESKILSDGEIRIVDDAWNNYSDLYVSEDAQWLLEDKGNVFLNLYVTERTNEITTTLGETWNKEFNRILQKCKKDYYLKKKKEIRLYFYDADNDRLQLCYKDEIYYNDDRYIYSLRRLFAKDPYCAIDKRFEKPERSCFILGRIRKTIGLRNSRLLDFIEPVSKINLDFEKDKWDFGEYDEQKASLETSIFTLLSFCLLKDHDFLQIMRIRAYFENYDADDSVIVLQFKNKIQKSFERGNVEEIRNFYDVLTKRQSCINVKFELRLEEEIFCDPSKIFRVYFENGETDYMTAKWVYKNISNCTDTKGVYLGEIRNRYNFY